MRQLSPERVRELREGAWMSQQDLADASGFSLFTVQRIERGTGGVRPGTARAIARALGVTPDELTDAPKAPAPRERPVEPTSAGGSEELAEKFRKFEQQARKIAAGQALPRTAPSLVLAMEEELRRLDREGSLPESVIGDYMVRAFEITRDVQDALEEQQRDLVRAIAAIREPQERLGDHARDEGRARSAS